MAPERLSRLRRRILTWLVPEDQQTRGTMRTSHQNLVHALAHDQGNLSTGVENDSCKTRCCRRIGTCLLLTTVPYDGRDSPEKQKGDENATAESMGDDVNLHRSGAGINWARARPSARGH